MTEALGRLVTTLDVIGLEAFVPEPPRGAGRPPDDRRALARAFVAKAVLGVPTTTALIERLDVDKSLRRILGWERRKCRRKLPFPAPSRSLRRAICPNKMHAALIERSLGGRIVGVIARDATEIETREKPVKTEPNDKKEDPPPPMALSRRASADARARTRNGQNPSRRASNGRPRRTSIRCSPICPPRAMSAPRRTARATRKPGSATNCIWMKGSTFTAEAFAGKLAAAGVAISMDGRGRFG